MKQNKFFELAKQSGITDAELKLNKSTNLSLSTFNGEVVGTQVSDNLSIAAKGICNNKFGFALTNIDNKDTIPFLVDEILSTSKLIDREEDAFIFEGSKKYSKRNLFNEELEKVDTKTKLAKLFEIEKLIKAQDPRITDIETAYEESISSKKFFNSKGLKLSNKTNSFYIYASVKAQQGEDVVSYFNIFFDNHLENLNVKEFAEEAAKNTIAQFGASPCKSKKYKVLLNQESFASLINSVIGSVSAEEIQKHTSIFEGKLNTLIASKKLTVYEKPVAKTLFFTGFDDEGVATYNKTIIKNGVLSTYLYNLETAKKDGVNSTGNGYGAAKIGVSTSYLEVKPGKKSFDQLLETVGKEGIYITDISGLHAGLNAQSGSFSLQANGFLIKDGKLDRPLKLITLNGNLFDLIKDIKDVGCDSKVLYYGISTPSVLVKKLGVSGE